MSKHVTLVLNIASLTPSQVQEKISDFEAAGFTFGKQVKTETPENETARVVGFWEWAYCKTCDKTRVACREDEDTGVKRTPEEQAEYNLRKFYGVKGKSEAGTKLAIAALRKEWQAIQDEKETENEDNQESETVFTSEENEDEDEKDESGI